MVLMGMVKHSQISPYNAPPPPGKNGGGWKNMGLGSRIQKLRVALMSGGAEFSEARGAKFSEGRGAKFSGGARFLRASRNYFRN